MKLIWNLVLALHHMRYRAWYGVLLLYALYAMLLGEKRRSSSSESFFPHFRKLLHHLSSLRILFK